MLFKKHTLRSGSLSGSGRISCTKLLGIDSSANEVSISHADGKSYFDGILRPGSVNMIRTGLYEVSKRPGYKAYGGPDASVTFGGAFTFHTDEGEKFYSIYENIIISDNIAIAAPTDLNDGLAIQVGNCFVIFSKGGMFIHNPKTRETVCSETDGSMLYDNSGMIYTPTIFIAGKPNGEATAYQPINLINPYVCEMFTGNGTDKSFKLHLEADSVESVLVTADGITWQSKNYTVSDNRIVFAEAPSKPALTGEDNIKIIYKRKDYEDGVKKIANSTSAALFGIAGYEDRLFVAGAEPSGTVYYTEPDYPFYFAELNYIRVGSKGTRVKALASQGLSLAVICNDNVYTVAGKAIDDIENTDYTESAAFYITDVLKTPRAYNVAPLIFDNEIVYLTESGLCAITPSGVLDERCCQIRSGLINAHLLKENLSDCKMTVYGDFLVLSNRKGRLYLFDGKQFSVSADTPFSQRQYECYIWENVPAKYIWMEGKRLCFSDGRNRFVFNNGDISNYDYSDEDASGNRHAINAYWETPYIYAGDFSANKHFMRVGVLLDNKKDDDGFSFNTDVKVYVRFDNDRWRTARNYDGHFRAFSYADFDYGRMTYLDAPKTFALYCRLLHKKARAIKLRFENSNINEAFVLQGFNIEYIQM